jgi:hypothetical protein
VPCLSACTAPAALSRGSTWSPAPPARRSLGLHCERCTLDSVRAWQSQPAQQSARKQRQHQQQVVLGAQHVQGVVVCRAWAGPGLGARSSRVEGPRRSGTASAAQCARCTWQSRACPCHSPDGPPPQTNAPTSLSQPKSSKVRSNEAGAGELPVQTPRQSWPPQALSGRPLCSSGQCGGLRRQRERVAASQRRGQHVRMAQLGSCISASDLWLRRAAAAIAARAACRAPRQLHAPASWRTTKRSRRSSARCPRSHGRCRPRSTWRRSRARHLTTAQAQRAHDGQPASQPMAHQ